ncbi:TetR family transcriptional regulator C-terminal domain-containing protein [Abyssibius alkaniclasticus]|uniref:TetR family transcriptional regulator C-terminal domain-containing protein n=1 Tax=Abyssibius alkaniclasticus TaxID=2881234 RepID=UPI002363B23B|nr:TetR family transcriptional regulator C-terminal domain-containing protein [Abyssibius alkaniclasticus]UPH70354.1 TetR family transcriptional regulator C-terminal domain-containing protein [Abyssibius alkaniclasticus]
MEQNPRPARTRIQRANAKKIFQAALDVFSTDGFRGATIEQIAQAAGMSKPNLLYYYSSKEEIYRTVLDATLALWMTPLHSFNPDGDPLDEIRRYIRLKLEMAREYPRESRLFANEMLRGAPVIGDVLEKSAKAVNEKCKVIEGWIAQGRLQPVDPRHLFFAIWATTQHYADFDAQISVILGADDKDRFKTAAQSIESLFFGGLKPG